MCEPIDIAAEHAKQLRMEWHQEWCCSDYIGVYSSWLEDRLEQAQLKAAARADERDELARRLGRFTGRTAGQELSFFRDLLEDVE